MLIKALKPFSLKHEKGFLIKQGTTPNPLPCPDLTGKGGIRESDNRSGSKQKYLKTKNEKSAE